MGKIQDKIKELESKKLDIEDQLEDYYLKAKKEFKKGKRKVEDKIIENPLESVLIAAGVGFLIGKLLEMKNE